MVLLESFKVPLGTPAPAFSLEGVDDQPHSLDEYKGFRVLVVIFMCNHCPYVQAQWPRLIELQKEFEGKSVRFLGINSNFNPEYPEDSFEKMKEYAAEYGMNFPYLQDPSQETARAFKAQCTPDIFVYDHERRLVYHGRIDDNWKELDKVTSHDLKDAIQMVLDGKKPDVDQKPSMGCSIKWRE